MITVFLKQGQIVISIKIKGKDIYFGQIQGGTVIYHDIDSSLWKKMPIVSITRQFPDLEGKPLDEIRAKSIKRYKALISTMDTEEEIKEYLIKDCKRYGMLEVKPKSRFREVFASKRLGSKVK